jgi:hypothetical protein
MKIFCEHCGSYHEIESKECPEYQQHTLFNHAYFLAKEVINALPKCDKPYCSNTATRHETYNFGTAHTWRCDEHEEKPIVQFMDNRTWNVPELAYAQALRAFINFIKGII